MNIGLVRMTWLRYDRAMQYPTKWVPLIVSESDPTSQTFSEAAIESENLLDGGTYEHVELAIRRNDNGAYSVPVPLDIYGLHRVRGIVGPFSFGANPLAANPADPADERWLSAWAHLPECIAYYAKAATPITGAEFVSIYVRTVDKGRAV